MSSGEQELDEQTCARIQKPGLQSRVFCVFELPKIGELNERSAACAERWKGGSCSHQKAIVCAEWVIEIATGCAVRDGCAAHSVRLRRPAIEQLFTTSSNSMKDKLLAALAKLWVPTLVRHLVTAAGGYVAAAGIDGSSTTGIIAGGVLYTTSMVWSLIEKKFGHLLDRWQLADAMRDPETQQYNKQIWSMILGALTSQAVTMLTGWLLASGYGGDVNDPLAVGLFLANFGLSKARGPASAKTLTGK